MTASAKIHGLDLDTARGLFDALSSDGPADFSMVEQYYHPDVRFQDPIQQLQGRDAFVEMSETLVRRCKELRARANDAAQTGDLIFLQWTMEMRFGPSPLTTIEGTTKLRLGEDGRVIEHRDYFDLWGDTLRSMPGVARLYNRFVGLMG